MISVLIPVYNCDITSLVKDIHSQLVFSNIAFEIHCIDDNSTELFTSKNDGLNELNGVIYQKSKNNNGIAITRQKLVENATFDWVLLIDADTQINSDFIGNYINYIESDFDYIFGGFAYQTKPPSTNYLLRWKYGRKCEARSAKNRNKNPYKVTIAANLFARKEAYLKLNIHQMGNNYAMDYYFGSLLKSTNAKVLHIDNQVTHLGIETSDIYLSKKEKAVNTLLSLYTNGKINEHSNDLLKAFLILKKFKVHHFFAFLYKRFRSKMQQNLTGKNPSIKLLQFYKISYMCYINLKN